MAESGEGTASFPEPEGQPSAQAPAQPVSSQTQIPATGEPSPQPHEPSSADRNEHPQAAQSQTQQDHGTIAHTDAAAVSSDQFSAPHRGSDQPTRQPRSRSRSPPRRDARSRSRSRERRGGDPEDAGPNKRLYVGNLSWSVDDQSLKNLFAPFGTVDDVHVAVERESMRSRGFGFVTMATEEQATRAKLALDGEEISGRRVRIDYALPRGVRAPRTGPRDDYGSRGRGGGGYRGGPAMGRGGYDSGFNGYDRGYDRGAYGRGDPRDDRAGFDYGYGGRDRDSFRDGRSAYDDGGRGYGDQRYGGSPGRGYDDYGAPGGYGRGDDYGYGYSGSRYDRFGGAGGGPDDYARQDARYGDRRPYDDYGSHGRMDSRGGGGRPVCHQFQRGHCTYGDQCKYIHAA